VGDARSFAVADDITPIRKEELVQRVGAVPGGQMTRVDSALRAALSLD
jgi:mRNA-degrading endonuclease toxin of MazEF toxin-antitoxin module